MKHIKTFENFVGEATSKPVTKQDWNKADDEQRETWLSAAVKDPDEIEKLVGSDWDDLPDEASSNMTK